MIKGSRLIFIRNVARQIEKSGRIRRMSEFKCECGNIKVYQYDNVRSGGTKSCGCLNLGVSRTSEYQAWKGMNRRCYNPLNKSYKNYGLRGITVCEEWRDDVSVFMRDMGLKPTPKHQIDRIDNNGNYEPGNCRWVLAKINNQNTSTSRRWTIHGKIYQSCTEAGKALGVDHSTIRSWCKNPNKPDCSSDRVY